MKTRLHSLLTGILIPVIMSAQVITQDPGISGQKEMQLVTSDNGMKSVSAAPITYPDEYNLNLYSGKELLEDLIIVNDQPYDVNYEVSIDVEPSLIPMGWLHGSTPLDGDDGILDAAPDQAMFVKDFMVSEGFSLATLYLGFDDGCKVWINGVLALDYKYNDQWLQYWNTIDDITSYLQEGKNRISVVVFNGVYGGGGGGAFDCQLTIDDIDVIKRGDENYNEPEAMWYFYGQTGERLVPPRDGNQLEWWQNSYGNIDWVTLNRSTGQQLLDMGWIYHYTPASTCSDLLSSAPDIAQFITDVYIPWGFSYAELSLGYDDGCRVWINGELVYDYAYDVHSINYWDAVEDVTGLLKPYRNRIAVEVYNGIWGGGAAGDFDCQLVVDGVDLIKRGDLYAGSPESMWYMYGAGGEQYIPADDLSENKWFLPDYGLLDQLPATVLSGFLPAETSHDLKVVFNANGLPADTYLTQITVSFENTEETTEVPATLYVDNGPSCEAYPKAVDFGTINLGYTAKAKFSVINTGSDVLEVWGIFPDDMYSVIAEPSWFSLDPGKSQDVDLFWTNYYDDKYQVKNLYIDCNDPEQPYTVVTLTSYGVNPPELGFPSGNSIYAMLDPNGYESQILRIENWGPPESILNFTLPQGQPLKKQDQVSVKPLCILTGSESKHLFTLSGRLIPEYFAKDIKSYKNLLMKPDNNEAGVNGAIDLFFDDLENGPGNWMVINYRQTEIQWHLTESDYSSPNRSWWCGNETLGSYENDSTVTEAIITEPIVLPPLECNITLEFNETWEVENNYDQCFVDISTDDGNYWERIREGVPGSSGGWITTSLDLSDYWDQTIRIRFLFDTGDREANDFPGWFIDDVRVYVDDPGFLTVSPNEGSIVGGDGLDITVNFDAFGYDPGYYQGFVLIRSNDPNYPQYYVPADMEVIGQSFNVSLNIILEGAYSDGIPVMTTHLNNVIPLEQPYNTAPWNYNGGETVPEIPSPDIVDWVLVELRDAPDAASATPFTTISWHAALLRNDGQVVGMDGISELTFYSTVNDQLFGVVWHRNHLGVMSAFPLALSEGTYYYYFSTDEDKVYGGSSGHKMIGDGVWGMYAGNGNGDSGINDLDKTEVWQSDAGKQGYMNSDFNMNKQVDNQDKNDIWMPNEGKSCQVPGLSLK